MIDNKKRLTSRKNNSKEKEDKEVIDILKMLKGIKKKVIQLNNKPQKVIE